MELGGLEPPTSWVRSAPNAMDTRPSGLEVVQMFVQPTAERCLLEPRKPCFQGFL